MQLGKIPFIGRRARRTWLVLGTVVALTLAIALPGLATLSPSTFNAGDGNLTVQGSETDWATPAPNLQKGIDKPTGQNDDSFGQGTKEDTAVPTVVSGQIPNNKSDLTRFYVANEKVGGKEFLYLAWERVQEPNGTTNMDFEFNQDATKSSNGVTPVRTAGDVLIKYDLSQGGTHPTLGYHLWVTSGKPATVCEANNSVPCRGKVQFADRELRGSINDPTNNPPNGEVVDPIPPDAPRTLSVRTFGEAAVNLTDSGIIPAGSCKSFGAAYLKSRASDSFTAAVKDFIAPVPVSISNCGQIIIRKVTSPSPDPTSSSFSYSTTGGLTPASFSLKDSEKQDYGDNVQAGAYSVTEADPAPNFKLSNKGPSPLAGAEFDIRKASDNSLVAHLTTDSNGVACVDKLLFGDYNVNETNAPSGYKIDDTTTHKVTVDNAATCGSGTRRRSRSATRRCPRSR